MGDPFHWIGLVVVIAACVLAVSFLAAVVIRYLHSPYGPHAFFGKPQLRAELVFYDQRKILTTKGGIKKTAAEIAAETDKVDHYFDVPWWAGFSTRKGHFLFGFLKLRRHP